MTDSVSVHKFGTDEYIMMYKDFPENTPDKRFIATVLRKPRANDPGIIVVDIECGETFSDIKRWWKTWTPNK